MREPLFILGPGRSFTSVIGSMIGQHPDLFGLPETNLATAETVGQWYGGTLPGIKPRRSGALRLLAHLHHGVQSAEAVDEVAAWLLSRPGMTTAELYEHVERLVTPRRLVDKSPRHVITDVCLARLPRIAPTAKYLRIVRHPYSNGKSIVATGWYLDGLRAWSGRSWDRRTDPPTLDPQFHWIDLHERIDRFFASLPSDACRTVRGEDLLANPRPVLRQIARWLEIDESDLAIEAMLHPERSPFASKGPPNAEYGNDPSFLESPALRAFTPPKVPLSGRLPWRGDGEGFTAQVIARAREFGYTDEPLPMPRLPEGFDGSRGRLMAIEPDGQGFPMAHGNLLDNSCIALSPLRAVSSVKTLPGPAYGGGNFGAFTASDYAVGVFDSPREPALVGIDLKTGALRWQSELGLLPKLRDDLKGRFVGGLLLVRLYFENGAPLRCIFAGNRAEIVCLDLDGTPVWRRDTRDIVRSHGSTARAHGTPRCLRYTADNALIYGSRNGYVGKLDLLTGRTIDIADLSTTVDHAGDRVCGHFDVRQSIIVAGDFAYFQAKFTAEREVTAPESLPTALFRLRVAHNPDGRIERMPDQVSEATVPTYVTIGSVGDRRVGGSPSARRREDGQLVIFTNEFAEDAVPPGGLGTVFQYCGIRDQGTRLLLQWRCRVHHPVDAKVTTAPAVDEPTDTLIATHRFAMLLFARASWREGEIEPDLVVDALDCLAPEVRARATAAEFSSPISIARDAGAADFVAFVGLAVWTPWTDRSYAFLSALEVRTEPAPSVTPLWSRSIVVDKSGNALPAARSFAQPALFALQEPGGMRPGLIMGTMMDGPTIFC
ncbi:sulfotransferase family protein [Lamprocystis purpurea]|jgi:hypothetical protein|uniref:sulfotransferase family protein n=1 Tax=Lamprocystis purpurea TaxID=61598 RepID=UPI00036CAEDE|nr:sulfotransferase [Lamprocystis purpurea]